ncbi:MAG: YitT family protein [Bacteroidales bacterium]|nr:YitT family protein [Bacteroidales bacterium]
MPPIKKSLWTNVKEWLLVSLGILIYVSGWTIFLIPNNLVGGGVSGISSIIQYATAGKIQMGYTYFAINAILLVAAVVIIGMGFGAKTIFAIILASVGLRVLPDLIPAEIIQALALQNGKLMSTIMGGIMAGIGIGMSISNGGSTGGTDIIALIYTRYRNVSPGKVILYLDFVIILSSLFVPSVVQDYDPETGRVLLGPDGHPLTHLMPWAEKITTVVYGLILVTVNGRVIDMYLSGSQQSVQLFILSRHSEQIAEAITHELHRGVTVLEGKGWFSQKKTEVLMVLTRKTDVNLMLRRIKSIDPHAFLSVSSVSGVYGKGFDQIKGNVQAEKNSEKQ